MPTLSHAAGMKKPASVPPQPSPLARAGAQAGGQALDRHTQATMSSRFGHDFSQVRIHTDARAEESAEALGANAFTHGSDIVFGAGQYSPGSPQTERLLAHELTHVVQQAQFGTGDPTRASRKEDFSEREAEALAGQVVTGRGVQVQAAPKAAVARDEIDPASLVCTADDPGPALSSPMSVPQPAAARPPSGPSQAPVYGPIYQPPPATSSPGPVFGPQLRPPDPDDVSSPLDPSSRVCTPDPNPADVSCGMDISRTGPQLDYDFRPSPVIGRGGEKPGNSSGPYYYGENIDGNSFFEAGLYHHRAEHPSGGYTLDVGYANGYLGTNTDENGNTRTGARINAGAFDRNGYNQMHVAGEDHTVSLDTQFGTAGAEASAGNDGVTVGGGATVAGVAVGHQDSHESTRIGLTEGPSLAARGHWGMGEDGYRNYGVGGDIGPYTADVTTNDPVRSYLSRLVPIPGVATLTDHLMPDNITDGIAHMFGKTTWTAPVDTKAQAKAQAVMNQNAGAPIQSGNRSDLYGSSTSVVYEQVPPAPIQMVPPDKDPWR